MTLRIQLLGQPCLTHRGNRVPLCGRRPLALLTYLLLCGKGCTRSALAELLHQDAVDPRASLRWTLYQLRRALGEGYVAADRERITFNFDSDYWLDVEAFMAGESEWYRGELLAEQYLNNALVFMEWLSFQRERLNDVYQRALVRRLAVCEASGDDSSVVEIARRLLQLDNLRERWHRVLMGAYARQGKRRAALNQFELCRHLLQQELGVEPAPATQQLAAAIRGGNRMMPAFENRPAGELAGAWRAVRNHVDEEMLAEALQQLYDDAVEQALAGGDIDAQQAAVLRERLNRSALDKRGLTRLLEEKSRGIVIGER